MADQSQQAVLELFRLDKSNMPNLPTSYKAEVYIAPKTITDWEERGAPGGFAYGSNDDDLDLSTTIPGRHEIQTFSIADFKGNATEIHYAARIIEALHQHLHRDMLGAADAATPELSIDISDREANRKTILSMSLNADPNDTKVMAFAHKLNQLKIDGIELEVQDGKLNVAFTPNTVFWSEIYRYRPDSLVSLWDNQPASVKNTLEPAMKDKARILNSPIDELLPQWKAWRAIDTQSFETLVANIKRVRRLPKDAEALGLGAERPNYQAPGTHFSVNTGVKSLDKLIGGRNQSDKTLAEMIAELEMRAAHNVPDEVKGYKKLGGKSFIADIRVIDKDGRYIPSNSKPDYNKAGENAWLNIPHDSIALAWKVYSPRHNDPEFTVLYCPPELTAEQKNTISKWQEEIYASINRFRRDDNKATGNGWGLTAEAKIRPPAPEAAPSPEPMPPVDPGPPATREELMSLLNLSGGAATTRKDSPANAPAPKIKRPKADDLILIQVNALIGDKGVLKPKIDRLKALLDTGLPIPLPMEFKDFVKILNREYTFASSSPAANGALKGTFKGNLAYGVSDLSADALLVMVEESKDDILKLNVKAKDFTLEQLVAMTRLERLFEADEALPKELAPLVKDGKLVKPTGNEELDLMIGLTAEKGISDKTSAELLGLPAPQPSGGSVAKATEVREPGKDKMVS